MAKRKFPSIYLVRRFLGAMPSAVAIVRAGSEAGAIRVVESSWARLLGLEGGWPKEWKRMLTDSRTRRRPICKKVGEHALPGPDEVLSIVGRWGK
jgi:hypothetical protein